MVNIIENYAYAEGIVRSIKQHDKLPGYHQIELELKTSKNIGTYPNLAKADEGKTILVNIKNENLGKQKIQIDQPFSCDIRKSSPHVYFMK